MAISLLSLEIKTLSLRMVLMNNFVKDQNDGSAFLGYSDKIQKPVKTTFMKFF